LQPPLPLQLFLPLQPWSPWEQPPWPLQLFIPLQSCLAMVESEAAAAGLPESLELWQPVVARVPATNPAIAADTINVLAVRVILFPGLTVFADSADYSTRSQTVRGNLRVPAKKARRPMPSSSDYGTNPYNISVEMQNSFLFCL
jgi:hypothetical protein